MKTHRHFFLGLLIGLAVVVSACSPSESFANATISTPVAVLPIAITSPQETPKRPTPLAPEIITQADAEYLLFSNVYERSVPSVVNVEARRIVIDNRQDSSRGSGWIYDDSGYIITNAHIIRQAVAVRVTFSDGYVAEADIVGLDTYSDLGVVRVNVDKTRLAPLTLANSDLVRVGQRAISIGNPFGLNSSMTNGIVSGIGRTLLSAELIDSQSPTGYQNPSIIQVDTPINVGNSGGPLLNSYGEVIGVTSAIRTDTGVFQGVGFAVPSNTVARIVPQLIANGRVAYPWLGISITPETNGYGVAGLAEALNLPVKRGVLVRAVASNSPSSMAGLRGGNRIIEVRGQAVCVGGDIIIGINSTYINNMDELTAYLIANASVGERVILRVVRDGESFDVPVLLQERPSTPLTTADCQR